MFINIGQPFLQNYLTLKDSPRHDTEFDGRGKVQIKKTNKQTIKEEEEEKEPSRLNVKLPTAICNN